MNKKLKFLILSDILILSSFGLIAPIFAIFISEDLNGGIVAAGLATAIFLGVRSTFQLPLAKYLIDKQRHKARLLLMGTLLVILVPFIYTMAKSVEVIFIAQAIYGLGTALAYPAWFSLFTSYIDKRHRGFEYALWSTGVGLGTGIAAFVGAEIASTIGFRYLFFFVGGMAILGFLLLIVLYRAEEKEIREEMKIERRKRRKRNKLRKYKDKLKRRKAIKLGRERKKRERDEKRKARRR